MIHLACVVDDRRAAQETCGVSSQEVVVPLERELACVGRLCHTFDPSVDSPALVDHDRVVGRIMRSCSSVVPFRYGTVLADPDAVRAELTPRLGEMRDLLDRFRGRVELAVRVAPADAARARVVSEIRPADRPGSSYLRSLRPETGRRALRRLHLVLSGHAIAAAAQQEVHGGMKASYLVERVEADSFARRLERVVAETDGLGAVSLTGPWAPYTFAALINAGRPSEAAEQSGGSGRD